MKGKYMKNKKFKVYIDEKTENIVRELAEKQNISLSEFVRNTVKECPLPKSECSKKSLTLYLDPHELINKDEVVTFSSYVRKSLEWAAYMKGHN